MIPDLKPFGLRNTLFPHITRALCLIFIPNILIGIQAPHLATQNKHLSNYLSSYIFLVVQGGQVWKETKVPKFNSSLDLPQPLLIHHLPEEAAEPRRLVPLRVQVCPSIGRTDPTQALFIYVWWTPRNSHLARKARTCQIGPHEVQVCRAVFLTWCWVICEN